MIINQIIGRLRSFFLTFLGIIRRGMCIFSRRRRSSQSDSEQLEVVSVVVDRSNKNPQERDWNSWDDAPRTVEEHIEQYRKKLGRPPTPNETVPEPDFFEDMVPAIKPQPKLFINVNKEEKTDFSRLEAKTDVPIPIASELEDWNEEDQSGWEGLDAETTKQLIREKRKEMRSQRQNAKHKEGPSRTQHNFAERIVSR